MSDLETAAREWTRARKALIDHYNSGDLSPPKDKLQALGKAEDTLRKIVESLGR